MSRRSAFSSLFCFDDGSVELQKFDIVIQVETYVNKLVFGFRFFYHRANTIICSFTGVVKTEDGCAFKGHICLISKIYEGKQEYMTQPMVKPTSVYGMTKSECKKEKKDKIPQPLILN